MLGQLDSLGVAVADQAAGLEATRSRVMDMAEQMSAGRRVATAAGERAEEAGARAQEAVARADGVAARVDEAERRLELALRALGALERAAADAGGQARRVANAGASCCVSRGCREVFQENENVVGEVSATWLP